MAVVNKRGKDLSKYQMSNRLGIRVVLVYNKCAHKLKYPKRSLKGLVAPRTILGLSGEGKAFKRMDITDFVKNIGIESGASEEMVTYPYRVYSASSSSVSLTLDNRHERFNYVPPGTAVLVQRKNNIWSSAGKWKTISTTYVWDTVNSAQEGGSQELQVTCHDRLFWLSMAEVTAANIINSGAHTKADNIQGANATKFITKICNHLGFPLGKVDKISQNVKCFETISNDAETALELFNKVLLLTPKSPKKQKYVNDYEWFDVHARNGKLNVQKIRKPKRALYFTDDTLITSAQLQETHQDTFATRFLVKKEPDPKQDTGNKQNGDSGGAGSTNSDGVVSRDFTCGTRKVPVFNNRLTKTIRYRPFAVSTETVISKLTDPKLSRRNEVLNLPAEALGNKTYVFDNIPQSVGGSIVALTPQSKFRFEGTIGVVLNPAFGDIGSPLWNGTFIFESCDFVQTNPSNPVGGGEQPTDLNQRLKSGSTRTTTPGMLKRNTLTTRQQKARANSRKAETRRWIAPSAGGGSDGRLGAACPVLKDGEKWGKFVDANITFFSATAEGARKRQFCIQYKGKRHLVKYPEDISFRQAVTVEDSTHITTMYKNIPGSVVSTTDRITAAKNSTFNITVLKDGVGIPGSETYIRWHAPNPVRDTAGGGDDTPGGGSGRPDNSDSLTEYIEINPTNSCIQKTYGIVPKQFNPAHYIPCKSAKEIDFEQQIAMAKYHINYAYAPKYTASITSVGIIELWNNDLIWVNSKSLGLKGTFIADKVSYVISNGRVTSDISFNASRRLSVKDLGLNQDLADVKQANKIRKDLKIY